ncbi:hypothetical protein [Neomegalonema perideroedes]|uniref:hypothetical protein n=1 Tax=Neomegalonema perideroedes TaxID=217219 RepID=UPI00037C4106|nr:hypothetical protein [Neomegalonema perideroedes]
MFKIPVLMLVAAGAGLFCGLGGAQAAGPVDPDWPCVQRRVPQISLAQVWSGPLPDEAAEARAKDPKIQDLAARLAQRRTALPEAEALIAEFAAAAPPEDVTALYLAVFERINAARGRVMGGIARYAHKQAAMDKTIDALRAAFDALDAADPPDFDAIDAAEKELDWSTRIFQDRQQSLIYVCETPVILEQRAFALGRAARAHLP